MSLRPSSWKNHCPDSSDYQGDDLGEEARPSSVELPPVITEIDLTVGEVVRVQVEAMSTGKYSLVAQLYIWSFPSKLSSNQYIWSPIIPFPFSGCKGSSFNKF